MRPTKTVIARRAVEIGYHENMDIEPNAAEALAESCGNDIRQVMNALQMWATKAKGKGKAPGERISLKYKEFKDRSGEIGKDEVRVCEEQCEELRRRVYWTTIYLADISVRGIAAANFCAVSNIANDPSIATRFALRRCCA